MLFKKKEKQPQQDEIPPTVESKVSTSSDPTVEKDVAANELEAQNPKPITTDIVYPSGLKLVLLMISIFVGMFLVALVRSLF